MRSSFDRTLKAAPAPASPSPRHCRCLLLAERGFEGTYDTAIPTYEALAVGPHPADEGGCMAQG